MTNTTKNDQHGATGAPDCWAELRRTVEAQREHRARQRIAQGAGDRRFSKSLIEAARTSTTEADSRAKLQMLLGQVWDDAEVSGQRHVVAMVGAAVKFELERWDEDHRAA